MGHQVVRFDQHVVYLNFQVLSKLTLEQFVHQMLIRCSDFFQSEWHDFVTRVYGFNDECRLLLVPTIHLYLLVVEICI